MGGARRARGRTARGTAPDGGIFKSTDGGTTWKPLTERLARQASSQANHRHRAEQSQAPVSRSVARERQRRHLSLRRRRRNTGRRSPRTHVPPAASAAAIFRSRASIPRIPTSSTSPAPSPGNPPTAARPGPASAARPAATITRTSGSIPTTRNIILLVSDQGAIITVNGGETWSSWYNQPTAQMYHVERRQRFPVSRLQRPAGERLGLHLQPRQRRRRSPSAIGIPWPPRNTVTSRPIRSIPTSSMAASSRATTGAPGRRRTSRRSRSAPPTSACCAPSPSCSRRSIRTFFIFAANTLWKTRDGGKTLAADQPRPHAQDLGSCRPASASIATEPTAQAHAARRHLHRRTLAARYQSHLGRHRRWPHI